MENYVTEDQRRKAQIERGIEYAKIDPIEAKYMDPRGNLTEQGFEKGIVANKQAWHGLALVQDTEEDGELTFEKAFELIPELASKVVKKPVEYAGTEVPGKFFTVREYDDKPLGIVGSRYEVVQNQDAFSMLSDLVDSGEIVLESAISVRDGKTVAFLAKRPDHVLIGSEEVVPYILWTNNHDGTGLVQMISTPERTVCHNTLRLALEGVPDGGTHKIRHTRHAALRLTEAREALGISFQYTEALAAFGEEFLTRKVTSGTFDQFLGALVKVPEENYQWIEGRLVLVNQRTITNRMNLKDGIRKVYTESENLENIRNTAWGVLQAVVEHEQHQRSYRSPDRRLISTVTGDNLNQEACELIGAITSPS